MDLVEKDIKARDIINEKSIRNALTCDMALGCSSNTVLHLLAIAHEAGVKLNMEIFNEVSGKTPNLCHLAPAGGTHMHDLNNAGGVQAVLAELSKKGLIDTSAITANGHTVAENIEGKHTLDENSMAVIGIRNTDHRPVMSVIGSSDENAGRGIFGKMKEGMVIAVHPEQVILVAIVIAALASFAAVYGITHSSENTKPSGGDNSSNISEYGASENRAEKGMPVSDTGSGMLTFSKKDVPDAIRNDIAYYSTQFYDGKVVLNPVMAYVRSTGANVYGPATMYKVTDNMSMNWYGRTTNIVTFFDKNKKMIAYGFAYATDPPKTPKMIMVYYAFGLDEKAIEARVRIDVESQIKDLPELNESDFKYVYYKEKKLYTLTLTDSAIKKYGNSFTSSSNYWSSDSKQKRTNEIKSLMADMWIGENKIIGEDTSIKRLGKICTYHGRVVSGRRTDR